ncbi:hypothetical protein MGMO_26c00280 [Methyloglobulus morosus KoM1]|uniref:Lipoprotein n=1 Tax=Methyloglobulus morosus KoM1 TaxID=1116472 RepID=V5E179_9GAMM|nr:hypothetical protein [Methyloglobulus morosus]ESS73316.1 hypothetical protein MGMO_26c00280 [Methyloglobulus morosus KoM1]
MNALYKTIVAVGLLGLLSGCAYDPALNDSYSSASDSYYGQGYRQGPGYGSQGYGYSNNGYSGYRQPTYGYGYSGDGQSRYCPDDD